MTELTFTTGTRADLDLRGSAGAVTIQDWDGATIKIASAGDAPPYVLRDGDTFRLRMPEGGTVSLPIGLPAEVVTVPAVQLRIQRAGGDTGVRPAMDDGDRAGASTGSAPTDFSEFAEVISAQGRRILQEFTRAAGAGAAGAAAGNISDEVARKLDEVADRIDDQAHRVAERIQKEVERAFNVADRYEARGRKVAERAAEQAEERARDLSERLRGHARSHTSREEARAERQAARAERHATRGERAGRGRWWFSDVMDEWASGPASRTAGGASSAARATQEERLAIMKMLQEGKITPEQAAQLLDALGG
jgi:hypothetical protein